MRIFAAVLVALSAIACQSHQPASSTASADAAASEESTSDLSNEQIIEIYAANQEAIDLVWLGLMSPETTLREATLRWLELGKPTANEVIIAIYAENEEEIAAIWLELGEEATMRMAVEEWIQRRLESL